MLKFLTNAKEAREEGFTIVELMVSILLIGILSAIAIPAYMNQRKSAIDVSATADAKNAAIQVETAIADFPTINCVKLATTNGTVTTASISMYSNATTISNSTTGNCNGTLVTSSSTLLSKGTLLTAWGDPNSATGYTIRARNTNGSKAAAATGVEYISNAGGIK